MEIPKSQRNPPPKKKRDWGSKYIFYGFWGFLWDFSGGFLGFLWFFGISLIFGSKYITKFSLSSRQDPERIGQDESWARDLKCKVSLSSKTHQHKLPVAPFSVRAFCTISSSSGPLKVHFVWEAWSIFCSACTKWCGNWLVFLEKVIFRLCFHAILAENYVKFNIVWNRLCPHNMCHRIKIGKRKRGLRGIFIIIFVQNLSRSVRI